MSTKSPSLILANEQSIESIYVYGKSIMDERIDTCPLAIFKPESTWYQSLNRNIDTYTEEINSIEDKLKLMSEELINDYIEKHFESRYDKYAAELEQKINQCTALINTSTPSPWIDEEALDELTSTLNQYEDQLNHLSDSIETELRDEYMRINELFENKYELRKQIHQLDRLIDENKNDLIEWKNYCLSKAKEEEHQRLIKFLSIPHSNEDVIRHLNEFIRDCINNNYTELLDEYYDMFENLFDDISKVNYKKTIRSVFDNKSSIKVSKAFAEHNQLLATKLTHIINYIQFNDTDQFELIEETLKQSLKQFIETQFLIIYQFLHKTIDPLKNSSDIFTNSSAVRSYAQTQISIINQILIRDLNNVLNERFNDYIEDLMEKLNINTNSTDTVTKSLTYIDSDTKQTIESSIKALSLDFNSFLQTVPDECINITELTSMYNNYFGTNLSNYSISMMKSIRNSFIKQSKVKNGKRITFYIKNH